MPKIENAYIAKVAISFGFNYGSAFTCNFCECVASQFYLATLAAVEIREHVQIKKKSRDKSEVHPLSRDQSLSVTLLMF